MLINLALFNILFYVTVFFFVRKKYKRKINIEFAKYMYVISYYFNKYTTIKFVFAILKNKHIYKVFVSFSKS